uniref:Phage tail collar domain-containing protein n=1 Tax=viral metagenome TaxID=1070528 RepID=A0A6C0I620_9ZZZZ
MSFLSKNKNINFPSGSIISYLALTSIDPSGWIICNGIQRTNGTDGRYNTLLNLGIGSGSQNGNYTPPNLSAAFLRGAGSQTYNSVTYNGSATINTFQGHATQQHTHTLTDPGHTHTQNSHNHTLSRASGDIGYSTGALSLTAGVMDAVEPGQTSADSVGIQPPTYSAANTSAINNSSTSGITNGDMNITASNTNEMYPFNVGTIWILKF